MSDTSYRDTECSQNPGTSRQISINTMLLSSKGKSDIRVLSMSLYFVSVAKKQNSDGRNVLIGKYRRFIICYSDRCLLEFTLDI